MRRRTWIAILIGAMVLGGVAVANNHPGAVLMERGGRRTWIVTHADQTRVSLPGKVRPGDALVCVLDGVDKVVGHLVDLYTKPGSGHGIWIEGDRIESPPEGQHLKRGVFDREPMGHVYIYCGDVKY